MKRYLKTILFLVILLVFGTISVFAEDHSPLTVTPSPPGRGHTEIGTIALNHNSTNRSSPEKVSLQAGGFYSGEEKTLEEVVEEEARSQNRSFSITIAVEQPNPGTYDCASYGGGKLPNISYVNIGHTFVLLGNHVPDTTVYYAKGFYPNGGMSQSAVLNNTSVEGIILDDTGHIYDVRRTYWVDVETFNKAVIYLNDSNEKIGKGIIKYNLVNFNCTTFAKSLLEAAGIDDTGIADHYWQIPQYIKDKFWYLKSQIEKLEENCGCYPGAAGEQLKKSQK